MIRVLALDLAPSATGVADPSGILTTLRPRQQGVERLAWYRDVLDDYLADGLDLVVLEGYSYGSLNTQAHKAGELGGVIRLTLRDAMVPWAEIAPAAVKKYATGRGNAPKGEVFSAAIRRLGVDARDDNQADSAWLRAMALDAYHAAPPQVPSSHRGVLAKVTWPTTGDYKPFPPGWRTPG